MKTFAMSVATFFFCVSTANAESLSRPEVEAWRADLEFVRETLPDKHADLFHTLSRSDFDNSLNVLSEHVPSLTHTEIIVELAAIVAAVGDGHTRLTLPMVEGSGFFAGHTSTPAPTDPEMFFHHYPIRLYSYGDGLFVQKIGVDHKEYAGARVLRIGSMSAEQAVNTVSRVVHRDNDMQLLHLIPAHLVMPELLYALDIIEDMNRAVFTLETVDGAQHDLVLSPVAGDKTVQWVDARGETLALYLRNPDTNFWFEHIETERLVYLQYNEVYDDESESLAVFSERLTHFIASHDVDRLVIDLRFNPGGDNTLNRSLLHALIRSPKLRAPGSVFVIVGRGTFSAAMMFAIDLEKHTNAIFVGEPTGARLNHYGDSRKMQLPNSGLTIRASSLYWQYSGPRDSRDSLAPHVPAVLTSADYKAGRDPAMNAILELGIDSASEGNPLGDWIGTALGYRIALHVQALDESLEATIDFPDEGANGLALNTPVFAAPVLRFGFENGDQMIEFEGRMTKDTIIGTVKMRGQERPWVVHRGY